MFLGLPKLLTRLLIRIEATNTKSTCRHFPGVHLHLFHHVMRKITWASLPQPFSTISLPRRNKTTNN